jgi:hypothetical protein
MMGRITLFKAQKKSLTNFIGKEIIENEIIQ